MMHAIARTVIVLLLIAHVVVAPAEGKPLRTTIGDTPWTMKTASERPTIVYGEDDRIDHFQETDQDRLAWAASTCGLIEAADVEENPDGTYSLTTYEHDVCADEPFSGQPTAPFCTGFMIGPDLIATAGHCVEAEELPGMRFVFGFVMEDARTPQLTLEADQVYLGIELVVHKFNPYSEEEMDFAIVRVDRPITAPGARPFQLRESGVAPVGANVGVIGHPSGLPLKLAFGERTIVRDNSPAYVFMANLDSYGGNSGSPVIDPKTGLVEGILVRGAQDWVYDGDCNRSNTESDAGGEGEGVTKSALLARYVTGSGDPQPEPEPEIPHKTSGYPFSSFRW